MTNKIIGLLAAIVVILAVVAYQLWQQQEASAQSSDNSTDLLQQQSKEPKETEYQLSQATEAEKATETVEVASNKPAIDTDEKEEPNTEVDEELCQLAQEYDDWYRQGDSYESDNFMREVKDWAFSRGYFETEYSKGSLGIKKKSDYDYYEMDDLEEMAQAGDSMANVRFAYRLYLKGDKESMEKAQPYCDRAIADGYSALIICKSSHLVRKIYDERRKEETQQDKERLKQLELEFKAWHGVAAELGDEFGQTLASSLLAKTDFEFENETLQARTQELVEDIHSRRAQLGLGPIKHPPIPELLAYVLNNQVESKDAINVCFE